MTFEDCCIECARYPELVNQFCRITGNKFSKNGLELKIDEACGYDAGKEFAKEFCGFVYECIWKPLANQ